MRKNKYNLGDTVYYMFPTGILSGFTIEEVEVQSVQIKFDYVVYEISGDYHYWKDVPEDELFSSYKEAYKALEQLCKHTLKNLKK